MSLDKYIGLKELNRAVWDAFVRALVAEVAALRTDVDANKVVAQAVAARGLQVIEDYLSPLVEDAGSKRNSIAAMLATTAADLAALLASADGDLSETQANLAAAIAEVNAQRDTWLSGVLDASAVAETVDRLWLTPEERTAIAGAASSGDVTTAITSAIASLINGASADRDTLGEIASLMLTAVNVANVAQFTANTASKLLDTSGVWGSAAYVTLADAATIAVDLNTMINGKVTLAGNRTLGSPTNAKVGQSGVIEVWQDATGGRTLSLAADWETADDAAISIDTTASRKTLLFYHVQSTGKPFISAAKGVR